MQTRQAEVWGRGGGEERRCLKAEVQLGSRATRGAALGGAQSRGTRLGSIRQIGTQKEGVDWLGRPKRTADKRSIGLGGAREGWAKTNRPEAENAGRGRRGKSGPRCFRCTRRVAAQKETKTQERVRMRGAVGWGGVWWGLRGTGLDSHGALAAGFRWAGP